MRCQGQVEDGEGRKHRDPDHERELMLGRRSDGFTGAAVAAGPAVAGGMGCVLIMGRAPEFGCELVRMGGSDRMSEPVAADCDGDVFVDEVVVDGDRGS